MSDIRRHIQLIESTLVEYSKPMEFFSKSPKAIEIIQHLHKNNVILHDADFTQYDIKSSIPNNSLLLIEFEKGVAGIAAKTTQFGSHPADTVYHVWYTNPRSDAETIIKTTSASNFDNLLKELFILVNTTNNPRWDYSWSDPRWEYNGQIVKYWLPNDPTRKIYATFDRRTNKGELLFPADDIDDIVFFKTTGKKNFLDRLKNTLGNIKKKNVYIAAQYSASFDKFKARKNAKKDNTSENVSFSWLLNRFKPFWRRTLESAKGELKNSINIMVKNDAYRTVSNKIHKLSDINDLIEYLDSETDAEKVGNRLNKMIKYAVLLATYHHYPDSRDPDVEFSQIVYDHQRYGPSGQTPGINHDYVDRLFSDIQKGDMQKLSTVLYFFKQSALMTA